MVLIIQARVAFTTLPLMLGKRRRQFFSEKDLSASVVISIVYHGKSKLYTSVTVAMVIIHVAT